MRISDWSSDVCSSDLSGANLFWLANDNVKPLLNLWRGVEQDRKKGMKIVAAFGPLLLAGALLRLLTIQQAVLLAGRRFGVKAHILPMPQPAACIDGGKPEDKDLGERSEGRRVGEEE